MHTQQMRFGGCHRHERSVVNRRRILWGIIVLSSSPEVGLRRRETLQGDSGMTNVWDNPDLRVHLAKVQRRTV